MYLSGTYTFNTFVDDQTLIFEKPSGSSTWTSITPNPGGAPGGTTASYTYAFSSGLYNIAIDWANECAPGLSAVQIVPP